MTASSDTTPRPRRRLRRTLIGSAAALVVALGGTGAWALDRFVIDHVEISDVAAYEAAVVASRSATATTSGSASSASAEGTATSAATTEAPPRHHRSPSTRW